MKTYMKKTFFSLVIIFILTISGVASHQAFATAGDGTTPPQGEQTDTIGETLPAGDETGEQPTTQSAGDDGVQPGESGATGIPDEARPGEEGVRGEASLDVQSADGQILPDGGQINPDGATGEDNRRDGTMETVPTRIGGGYVLGARRSQTGEESILSSVLILVGVALLLGVLVAIGRKKKRDED